MFGAVSIFAAGCGQTGAPLPPSLKLPDPVTDLTAARVGDRVGLKWTMPRRTTDKLPLKGPQAVQICRSTSDGPCQTVATASFAPEKPASFDDTLPADLTAGEPRLLAYSINVLSPHGRSAGSSNTAYSATGPAPPAFTTPSGKIAAQGVVLQWQAASLPGTEHKVEIERSLVSIPEAGQKSPPKPGIPVPAPVKEQRLVVRLAPGADAGNALDADAAFDRRYSYRISRVTTIAVDGKSIDIAGTASPEIVVETKDIFPPAAPTGLAAVAAADEGAIDLSWSPNTEADLAGYAVYRGEAGRKAVRISAAKLIDAPGFRDTSALPNHEYAYSVAAIDRDGNEGSRSAEVHETLPPK